jgi:isopentenyl-diphosphate delta-isomerase type 1
MMVEDLVVLLDDSGNRIGTMPKSSVHGTDTPLHLAFSVYVFDSIGRTLITRRSLDKLTWPGVWTNACCGHVKPDERPIEAARRRLREELSLTPDSIDVALADFRYRAISTEGIVENEICPVFIAISDQEAVIDSTEVADWFWISWINLHRIATESPGLISPWATLQIPLLSKVISQVDVPQD